MKMLYFQNLTESARSAIKRYHPEILIGLGLVGMFGAVASAIYSTPKAVELLKEKEAENESLPKKVRIVWKNYIPTAVLLTTSTACIVGASSTNYRRNAALAAAYSISEATMREYKHKVKEVIGEKKEQLITDAIAKDKIDENPVNNREIVITEKGNTLCYDATSGRYFKSDIEELRYIENCLAKKLHNENYISLNEYYTAIGLPTTTTGDLLGWNYDTGMFELTFSSQIASDGSPCLVVDYTVQPCSDYYSMK